jgi:hypothetical protein
MKKIPIAETDQQTNQLPQRLIGVEKGGGKVAREDVLSLVEECSGGRIV